jgi:hypothetical protein
MQYYILEQCSFTGGRHNSFAMSVFFSLDASSTWIKVPTIKHLQIFLIHLTLNFKVTRYSKTWLIQNSVIWNFVIIQILVLTYVPRRKISYKFTWLFWKPW